jgi:precorrin-6B methylase 2
MNARKPEGKLGGKLIEKMNVNHEGLAQWSLSHLEISKDDIIQDIGCGGGVN